MGLGRAGDAEAGEIKAQRRHDGAGKAYRARAALAPAARHRRQHDQGEGDAVERLRQAVVRLGGEGVAGALRQILFGRPEEFRQETVGRTAQGIARLGGELVEMGSAGAKAMAVVRSEAEIYLHSGGQYEWDSCAPVAVARAHGLHCSRIDGSPLVYNRQDPYLPDLLISRPEWTGKVMEALAAIG